MTKDEALTIRPVVMQSVSQTGPASLMVSVEAYNVLAGIVRWQEARSCLTCQYRMFNTHCGRWHQMTSGPVECVQIQYCGAWEKKAKT